jgi:hypothetical protein
LLPVKQAFPKEGKKTAAGRRLPAALLKKRLQLFCDQQNELIREKFTVELKQKFDGFNLPPNRNTDLAGFFSGRIVQKSNRPVRMAPKIKARKLPETKGKLPVKPLYPLQTP